MQQPDASPTSNPAGPDRPWEACVVPFAVFLAGGLLEPTRSGDGLAGVLGIPFAAYPLLYSLRIAATLVVIAQTWTPIRRWLGRPTWWPPLVGLALVVPWIVLASLERDAGWTTGVGERAAFNPFAFCNESGLPPWAFVAIRAVGLIAVVPLVEELFLRGFLMRYVINEDFWTVPFGCLTFSAAAACLVYAMATHPSECVAAAGWFAVVTGIAAATRRPIDTILAHAATNLALGLYVLSTGNWWLL
jgi:CAAX prenyl protease-like protein